MSDKTTKTSSGPSIKELEKKLADARTLVIMVMPHFAPLLEMAERYRKISIKEDCPTACTYPDGSIDFGRAYLAGLSVESAAFTIAHELGHHYMATFSRSRNQNSPLLGWLINIASDTQINEMIATYFEAHNIKTIREMEKGSQWWEKDRYWNSGAMLISAEAPDGGIMGTEFAEEFKIENLCKLLPAGRFTPIQELSMEDIVAALEVFAGKAAAAVTEKMLQKCSAVLNGSIVCKMKQSFPFAISVGEIMPQKGSTSAGTEVIGFNIDVQKVNPSKKEIGEVISKLNLNLELQNNFGEKAKTSIPLSINLPDGALGTSLLPGGEKVFVINSCMCDDFILDGKLTVTYLEDGTIFLKGYIYVMPDNRQGCGLGCSGQGGQGGQGDGKGFDSDLRSRDDLKQRHPDLSDEEIDRRIKEMEQARRQASSLVSGQGTAQDVEVKEGLYNVPWQAFLHNWLDGYSRIVRTYNRASRRGDLPDPRSCLPGHARCGYSLNILLDTSGSMEDLLPSALGAIAAFCERNSVDMIRIIECDNNIQDIKEIQPDDLRKYKVKGNGEFSRREIPQFRLPYDVLWCLVGSKKRINVPYGTQVHIK